MLDNSANVHILKDKSLFISKIQPYLLGADVGIVIGSNKLQGIGLVQIK